jgi:hypothetical protein
MILRIRPVDHLVCPYLQMQDKLSEGLVEGFRADFKTVIRLRRLLSEAEALGYNLADEAVHQAEADSDNN